LVSEDLGEVVKTMKTIAAVIIRQYEKAVASLRQYSRTIELGIQIVIAAAARNRLRRA
jgi:F-type H+-transporting ATPase subunit gamma